MENRRRRKAFVSKDFLKRMPEETGNVQLSRKISRNTGKEYYTQNGKIRPAKVFQNKDCRCSKGCIKLFTAEEREKIFDSFWELGDFNKQNLLLYHTIERRPVKRQRLRNGKGAQRNFNFKYFLTTASGKLAVCKRFFLDTFNVSEGRLQRTLKSEKPGFDMRGRATGSRRKIPEEEKKFVIHHISTFPLYPGSQGNVNFLHPDLNLKKLYNLYLLKCAEKNWKPVNEMTYRKIFKKEFNLYFHQPREDACQQCRELNIKFKSSTDEEKSKLVKEHDAHLKEADLARKLFQEDQNLALINPQLYFAFSFDLQKPLPYPRLPASDAYYKHTLILSNFCCHNFHDKKVYMYAWDETVASRGSEESASCILKHLKNIKRETHVVAYSDTYTGIKRSITVALTWLKIIQSPEHKVDIVDHKFLPSGHSTLPNDDDFESVETILRKSDSLFVPQDCYEAIRNCGKRDFVVNEMRREDFVSMKPLKDAIFRRLNNTEGESVRWSEIRWMRFVREEPYKMLYKTSMEAEFKALDLQPPRGEARNFNEIQLPPIYGETRPITKFKYKNLMDLLAYIPPAHHNYFKSLPHMQNRL